MANQTQVDLVFQGFEIWNEWRSNNLEIRPDLRSADLSGVNLFQMNLQEANLHQANLRGANLERAALDRAFLYKANLSEANLREASFGRAVMGQAVLMGCEMTRAKLGAANLFEAQLEGSTLNGAWLTAAYLRKTNLKRADLTDATLEGAVLIETDLRDAILVGCHIYGISVWNPLLDGTKQAELTITGPYQSRIRVDDIEVAQFIHLLLNNKNLRKVIDTVTAKAVLILGRFTPERKAILEIIRVQLREYGLLPIVFDFDCPSSRNTGETITTLARLSSFVIADITDPKSVPQELASIVQDLPSVPVQPLLQEGHEVWGMFDQIRDYSWVLELRRYTCGSDLVSSLKGIVETALRKRDEAIKRRENTI